MSNNKQIEKSLELPHQETIVGVNTIQTKQFDNQKIEDMSNKKQSSIEWLYNTIDYEIVSYLDGEIDLNELSIAMLKIKEQAKAMHKKEIEDAWNDGSYKSSLLGAKEYYNETFGGQDNE